MKRSTLNSILSLLFVALTVILLFAAWNSAKNDYANGLPAQNSVETASDLSSIKTEAGKLLDGLENNASLPVPVPTEKLSKDNPFSPAE